MNTQRKMLLGGFTAALMIGAALVAFAVPVGAQTAGAEIDADSTYVDGGVTYSRITSGSITYGDIKTIQVYDLAGACSSYACSTYTLWAPGATSANATAQAYPLNSTSYAVTFTNVNFSAVGNWSVYEGLSKTVTPEVSIQVNATINYLVSVQKEFTYKTSGAPQQVEISVADLAGNAASNAVVTVMTNGTNGAENGTALTVTNGGNGKYYVQLTANQGAGRYWITATRNVDGNGAAEYRADETTSYFDVVPGSLTVTKVDGSAIGGFTRTLTFNVSYPDGTHALRSDPAFSKVAEIGLQDGNGTWLNASSYNWGLSHTAGQLQVNVTGKPVTGHSYTLFVNLSQVGHSAKEFQGTLTWTASEPKALNLAVDPEETDVVALTGTPKVIGSKTVTLNVTGNLEDMQPGWNDSQAAANITVSGNTLFPATIAHTADAGEYAITFWPAEGDASLDIQVTFNGATETIKVPVKKGASVVADSTEFLVDGKGTVIVTVEDANGNRRADAEVAIYELNDNKEVRSATPLNSTLGDGSLGKGLSGQYTLTFTPGNVGNLTVYAVIGSGSAQTYGYAVLRAVASHDLTLNMNTTQAPYLAGKAYEFKFNVTNASGFYTDGTSLSVYNATEYAKFLVDPSTATAVETLTTGSGSANITATRALPAGTYYLYAQQTGTKKHDNFVNGALPSFTVGSAEVTFSPSAVVKTLDNGQNVSVSVKFNGEAVNGTLRIKSGSTSIVADNATGQTVTGEFPIGAQTLGAGLGNFTIVSTSKPAAEDGVVNFQFKPDTAGSSWVDIDATMKVVAPTIKVEPEQIYIGESNRVQVTVTHTVKGTPIANARVELYDSYNANKSALGTALANKTTGSDGKFIHQFFVASSGNHSVWVNDDFAGNVTPVQGLSVAFDATQYAPGKTVTVTVLQRGTSNAVVSGAQVMVGDEIVDGETDENGQITFAAPETVGTHRVTASADGFASGSANLKVFEEIVETANIVLKDLKVTDATGAARTTFKVGEVAVVSGTLENTGNGAGSVTVNVLVNGLSFGSADVTVQPGRSLSRAFTAPAFTAPGTYTVTLNDLPAVSVTVEAAPTTGGQTPGGQTPGGQTPGGQTPGGNQTPGDDDDTTEPGIPGFELVAALAAVGLAVLVIRRRN